MTPELSAALETVLSAPQRAHLQINSFDNLWVVGGIICALLLTVVATMPVPSRFMRNAIAGIATISAVAGVFYVFGTDMQTRLVQKEAHRTQVYAEAQRDCSTVLKAVADGTIHNLLLQDVTAMRNVCGAKEVLAAANAPTARIDLAALQVPSGRR